MPKGAVHYIEINLFKVLRYLRYFVLSLYTLSFLALLSTYINNMDTQCLTLYRLLTEFSQLYNNSYNFKYPIEKLNISTQTNQEKGI